MEHPPLTEPIDQPIDEAMDEAIDEPIDGAVDGPPATSTRRTTLQTAGLSVLALMVATVALTIITMGSSSGATSHHVAWFGITGAAHAEHHANGDHTGQDKDGTPDDGGAGAAGGCGGG